MWGQGEGEVPPGESAVVGFCLPSPYPQVSPCGINACARHSVLGGLKPPLAGRSRIVASGHLLSVA